MTGLPKNTQINALVLYYKPTCPFCRKVLEYLQKAQLEMALKDVTEGENRAILESIAGKRQVPCLVADKDFLHESDEIIEWLKTL